MVSVTVMASSIIKMADTMKDNGKITKWTVGVNYSTKAESSLTKEIGNKTNFMVLVKFITTTQ